MRINKLLTQLTVFILFVVSIFMSIYSITNRAWVWESGHMYQKILGTTSGLAAFTGVYATILFYKRKQKAYAFAILNAILFGSYALSINLTGDFIVNVIWYVPIMIYLAIKIKNGSTIKEHVINKRSSSMLVMLFVSSFILFLLLNPYINQWWSKIVGTSTEYGSYFNNYWAARVLDSLMNSVSVTAVIMMILGYKQAWYVWIPKNIAGLIFFSGVGILNISIIVMNILYLSITVFIIIKGRLTNETNSNIRARGGRENNRSVSLTKNIR